MFLICTILLIFIKQSCKNEGNMHDKVRYYKSCFTIVGCNLFSRGCDHMVTWPNHGSNLANKNSW